jgi:hypothetical protein
LEETTTTSLTLTSSAQVNLNSDGLVLQEIYGQCGGKYWKGPTRCVCNAECHFISDIYASCQPVVPQPGQVVQYGTCGGQNYLGPVECVCGYICVYRNPYYSQCLPTKEVAFTTQKVTNQAQQTSQASNNVDSVTSSSSSSYFSTSNSLPLNSIVYSSFKSNQEQTSRFFTTYFMSNPKDTSNFFQSDNFIYK